MKPVQLNSVNIKIIRKIPHIVRFSSETAFILSCAIAAFLFRFFLIPQEPALQIDSAHYLTLGKKIVQDGLSAGIHAYWPPLYPFLIGVTSLFTHDVEFAGRFVSIAAGTLLVIPSYFLMRELYGRVPAYYGVILIVVHPVLILSSGWVLTESLYTLLFTLVIFAGWKALKTADTRLFLVTGLLLGAAYLTKPEAIGFLALFLVLTFGAKFFRRKLALRSLAVGYLLLFVGFATFLLPYVIVIHQKTGHWTFSQKLIGNVSFVNYEGANMGLTNDGQTTRKDQMVGTDQPHVNQVQDSPPRAPGALQGAKFDYSGFLRLAPRNLKKELREHIPEFLSYPLILLIIVGFFSKPWTMFRTAREVYLASFFIATLLGYAVSVVEFRYLFPIIPILLCWVSNGIVAFGEWASITTSNIISGMKKISSPIIGFCILVIITASWAGASILSQDEPPQLAPLAEKRVGIWIKNNKTTPSLIMASSPLIAFYGETQHIYLPDEELSTVLQYARRKNVNYIVIARSNLKKTPKILIPNEENLPAELKLVYRYDQNPEYETFVYQLLY